MPAPPRTVGMVSFAFNAEGCISGPSMRSWPSAEPANGGGRPSGRGLEPGPQLHQVHLGEGNGRAAGEIAFQLPFAVAAHLRTGGGGLQVRAQHVALRRRRQMSLTQHLIGQLQPAAEDVGMKGGETNRGKVTACVRRSDIGLSIGGDRYRALKSGIFLLDGLDLLQRSGIRAHTKLQMAGIEMYR